MQGDETQSREASQVRGPVRVAWGVPAPSFAMAAESPQVPGEPGDKAESDPTTEAERLPEAVKEAAVRVLCALDKEDLERLHDVVCAALEDEDNEVRVAALHLD